MSGRPTGDKEMYRERVKQLVAIKLQLPLVDDMQAFVEGFPDWMKYKPATTLLKAGRYDQGIEYLDRLIESYQWNSSSHSKDEYLGRFGLSKDSIGDPKDKLRRKEKK
jgi:hypothetical protein